MSDHSHVVTMGEGGVHINHLASHNQKVIEGTMGSQHTFEAEEGSAFSNLINDQLKGDSIAGHLLPLDPNSNDIFTRHGDGLILVRLINIAQPGTIDEKKMNKHVEGREMSVYQKNENLNVVVKAASAIGCHIVNIGAADIMDGHQIPILGLIWQIFRIGLVADICLDGHPELVLLLEPGETLACLAKLTPEQLLLLWVKYNLNRSGADFKVSTFNDFKNPAVFLALLCQLNPSINGVIGSDENPLDIAQRVIDAAKALGIDTFLSAMDILSGNPRLALGLTAQIFNSMGMENDLQANAFAVYINYVLKCDPVVAHVLPLNVCSNDIYLRQYDGLIMAELLRDFKADALDLGSLAQGVLSNEQKLSNISCVLAAATAAGASFGEISASDILDARPKSVLAALWEIIKLKLLRGVNLQSHPELRVLGDEAELAQLTPDGLLLRWANYHLANGGNATPLTNYDKDMKDPSVFDTLLQQLLPASSDANGAPAGDALAVAAGVLDKARQLQSDSQLSPGDLVAEDPRIAEMFTAQLFNANTGLRIAPSAETIAFTAYVNDALAGNSDVTGSVPINIDSNDLYDATASGAILAALVNGVSASSVNASVYTDASRSRDAKIDGIKDILAAVKGLGGNVEGICAAGVVDGSASEPTHALELLLAIIRLRLTVYVNSLTLTVVRRVWAESTGDALAAIQSAVPEQTLLQVLGAHLTQSRSPLILSATASAKL